MVVGEVISCSPVSASPEGTALAAAKTYTSSLKQAVWTVERGGMRERQKERWKERETETERWREKAGSVQVLPAGGQGAAGRVGGAADHLHPPVEMRASGGHCSEEHNKPTTLTMLSSKGSIEPSAILKFWMCIVYLMCISDPTKIQKPTHYRQSQTER